MVFWIWIHLLMFDVSNQTQDPEEDLHNKPYRPLPSGRITLAHAIALRWLLVPVCWAVSMTYSPFVLKASVALTFFTFLYNELRGNGHFVMRNLLNALGTGCFELGATLVAGTIFSMLVGTHSVPNNLLASKAVTRHLLTAQPFWPYASALGYLRLPYKFRTSEMSRVTASLEDEPFPSSSRA